VLPTSSQCGVADVQDANHTIRAALPIRQKKTGKVIPVEISEATRRTLAEWIAETVKQPDDYLFTAAKPAPGKPSKPLTRRHYAH
jgi:hypothetical protein